MHKMISGREEKEVTGEIRGMHNIHLRAPRGKRVSLIFVPNVQRNIKINYATGAVTQLTN